MTESTIVLHQFPMSHYNEKARWALDFKGLDHERKSYLPGPHAGAIEKLSGQSSTPVLEVGDEVITGSASILAFLEERYPDTPSLLPTDEGERAAALAVQERFDAEVGPASRAVLFSKMMAESGYVTRVFGRPQPLAMRMIYRMVFPLARGKVQAAYRTNDPDYVKQCRNCVDETLDWVAEETADTGHLVGGSFSIADLTAAALLAPLADPGHADMTRPRPIPASVQGLLDSYSDHPGILWVQECYGRHRSRRSSF